MSLIKSSDSFPFLSSWMDDFWNTDRLFSDKMFTKELLPAVNIKEKDNEFIIEMTTPGMKKEDFKVHVENGILTISSESKKEEEEKNEKFTRKEFSYSSFSRSFRLPENVVDTDVNAKYDNGILKLTLQKKQIEAPAKKQIEVA